MTAIIVLILKASIILSVFAIGLKATFRDAVFLFSRPDQLVRAWFSMSVVMPVFALTLVMLFDLHPAIQIALIAISVSPIPPIFPTKAFKTGGTENYTIGRAIYLMVYAPYGRARLGIGTSAKEIDDLAAVVEALPPHHPLATALRGSRDALNADALADALLNPRDRAYSVSQLFNFLDRNGLEFGRWYWQSAYLPQCGSIAITPHAKPLLQLPDRERYAAMELWRGAMTAHNVVAYRSDLRRQEFSFDVDRWPITCRFVFRTRSASRNDSRAARQVCS
jgi:hypothetical protein